MNNTQSKHFGRISNCADYRNKDSTGSTMSRIVLYRVGMVTSSRPFQTISTKNNAEADVPAVGCPLYPMVVIQNKTDNIFKKINHSCLSCLTPELRLCAIADRDSAAIARSTQSFASHKNEICVRSRSATAGRGLHRLAYDWSQTTPRTRLSLDGRPVREKTSSNEQQACCDKPVARRTALSPSHYVSVVAPGTSLRHRWYRGPSAPSYGENGSSWELVGESFEYIPDEHDVKRPLLMQVCLLPDGAAWPLQLAAFPYEAHILYMLTTLRDTTSSSHRGTSVTYKGFVRFYEESACRLLGHRAVAMTTDLQHFASLLTSPVVAVPPLMPPLPFLNPNNIREAVSNIVNYYDGLSGSSLPFERLSIRSAKQTRTGQPGEISIATWNLLADLYATQNMFPDCASFARCWVYRRRRLVEELLQQDADILCLQEVQEEHFFDYFTPVLGTFGYAGVFKRKTRTVYCSLTHRDQGHFTMDGCATFYRKSRFNLKCSHGISFPELVREFAELGCEKPGKDSKTLLNLLRDNVALMLVLEDMQAPTLPPLNSDVLRMKNAVLQCSTSSTKPATISSDASSCNTASPINNYMGLEDPRCRGRRYLIIVNTHLASANRASEQNNSVRLIQAKLLIESISKYIARFSLRQRRVYGEVVLNTAMQSVKPNTANLRDPHADFFHDDVDNVPVEDHLSIPNKKSGCVAHTANAAKHSVASAPEIVLQKGPKPHEGSILPPLPDFWKPGVLLAGDFNSLPTSDVYELMTKGVVEIALSKTETPVHWFTHPHQANLLSIPMQLNSAVAAVARRLPGAILACCGVDPKTHEPLLTNIGRDFSGCLDYIFVAADSSVQPTQCRMLLDETQLLYELSQSIQLRYKPAAANSLPRQFLLPSALRSSDHTIVAAMFCWNDLLPLEGNSYHQNNRDLAFLLKAVMNVNRLRTRPPNIPASLPLNQSLMAQQGCDDEGEDHLVGRSKIDDLDPTCLLARSSFDDRISWPVRTYPISQSHDRLCPKSETYYAVDQPRSENWKKNGFHQCLKMSLMQQDIKGARRARSGAFFRGIGHVLAASAAITCLNTAAEI